MKFNLRKTISTFGSAVAITAVLSNAVYAIERTCSGAYEAEYKTPLGQTNIFSSVSLSYSTKNY
ncbi:MAG: hypothetical protein SWZ49_01625 [Cyanobacteriota bacterium]|nr:hypothetical protein [Cyanobacteriota bacterium]